MRITKRQLRRIIKEEKSKLLREQSPEAHEGIILANFASAMDRIEALKDEIYGLIDPAEAGLSISAGDNLAGQLQMKLEDLGSVYRQLKAYFETGAPTKGPR